MSDLISRCELFSRLAPVQKLGEAYRIIQGMPTVDAVPTVQCKDCKYRNIFTGEMWKPCNALVVPGVRSRILKMQ